MANETTTRDDAAQWAKERVKNHLDEPRRVVIKFKNNTDLDYIDYDKAAPALLEKKLGDWQQLLETLKRKDIVLERLLKTVDGKRIQELVKTARPSYQKIAPNFLTYFAITCPQGVDPYVIAKVASSWQWVEKAYVEAKSGPPPSVIAQGHLEPAPGGIDAKYAHNSVSNGTGKGKGVKFVDLEKGWEFQIHPRDPSKIAHVDLPTGISLLTGSCNEVFFGHGTACLGIVVAVENAFGCVGIAPECSAHCVSEYRQTSEPAVCIGNVTDAISATIDFFAQNGTDQEDKKGVLLIEAQLEDSNGKYIPVETQWSVYQKIQLATERGITVIEAAGNGDQSIDGMLFGDSGAIMVGAADSAARTNTVGSNFGQRIDCFAWGNNVGATGDGAFGFQSDYVTGFNGTSAASAIIAGAAILVQSIGQGRYGKRYSPAQVREILKTGTQVADLGWMPDLRQIIDTKIPATSPE